MPTIVIRFLHASFTVSEQLHTAYNYYAYLTMIYAGITL